MRRNLRILPTTTGAILGLLGGIVVAYVTLIFLDVAGVTNFVEDEPLHGWRAFVVVSWFAPLIGLVMGAGMGWWRSKRT